MSSFHPEQCDICLTSRFDTYCSNCTRHLCNECNNGHACKDKAGLVSEKEKKKLLYKTEQRKNIVVLKYDCDEHKSEYNRFCGTCGSVLCNECCSNEHVGHKIEPVTVATTNCRKIVGDLITKVNHDIETAVKLTTDLNDIISESARKKQFSDVKELCQSLETILVNAIQEKQKEEVGIISGYVDELQKCINAWDKNHDKLKNVSEETKQVPFLLKFCNYVHHHEKDDWPETFDPTYLKHERVLYFENIIEKNIADIIEYISAMTGIYTVSGIVSCAPTPDTSTISTTSTDISLSTTSDIHRRFTKHPQKEEPKINEKYVKRLQRKIESHEKKIQQLEDKLSEMLETSSSLKEYANIVVQSTSLTAAQKIFTKTDDFHKNMSETANVVYSLKKQIIDANVTERCLTYKYEQIHEEKEDIRQRFLEMAGRTIRSSSSARSWAFGPDQPILPKTIVEMFDNLYKCEWRETLDKLSISGKWKAHIVIQHLFMIVQTCFISCKQISAQQTRDMLSALFVGEEINKDQKDEFKYITDLKKDTAKLCAENLTKIILQKPEFQANLLRWEKKDYDIISEILESPYFNRCVYLTWFMVVQNPPMCMDEGPVRRSYINREVYENFTKKGSIIDYCVWPALYVEKDGPLGNKGIVQVY